MFYDAKEFKALEGGVQLSWMQQQLHLQNIANYETPGYKSKGMTFQQTLTQEQGKGIPDQMSAQIVSNQSASVRQEGNNVDMEVESLALYKTYAQYSTLLEKVKGQFNMYNYVLNSGMK